LRATTISKEVAEQHADEKVYIERAQDNITPVVIEPEIQPEEPVPDTYVVGNEVNITLPTENGYFDFDNPQIKILKRSSTSVTFMIPFGVKKVKIKTKEGGHTVVRHYVAQ
jgi:hypothetical protein